MTTIGIILGLFVGIGALADKLLLKHQKILLHQAMYNWWFRLEKTIIRDLGKLMAEYSLKIGQKIFRWRFWSWQNWVLLITISWVLTSTASIIGYYLTPEIYIIYPIPLPFFTAYIANFPFDLLTIYITFHVLKIIKRFNPIISILAIGIDILIAGALVIFCYASMWWLSDIGYNHYWWGSGYLHTYSDQEFKKNYQYILAKDGFTEKAIIKTYLKPDFLARIKGGLISYRNWDSHQYSFTQVVKVNEGSQEKIYQMKVFVVSNWASMAPPLTTFIPTFLYMILLSILILGKIIIEIAMHLLNIMTEADPEKDPKSFIPGTLIGLLCGIIASSVKVILTIIKTH